MRQPDIPTTERWQGAMRQEWARVAAGWRRWHPQRVEQNRAVTDALVRAAGIRPGMRVLDVASGTGDPALTLAELVGPDGTVTATDLAPEMLAIAEEHAARLGLGNLTCREAGAEALPFADRTFAAATCQFGIMFVADVPRALAEIRRVLKPGGRAAFTAWGPREQNPAFAIPISILGRYVDLPPPEPGAPGQFTFGQSGGLRAALEAAGYEEVDEQSHRLRWPWPGSAQQFAERVPESLSVRRLIERLTPAQREQAITEMVVAFRQFDDGQRLDFPAIVVVARGRRGED